MTNGNGFQYNSISSRNPQANAIIERVRQIIGYIIHTFKIQPSDLEDENPWEGILSPTLFAIRSMVRTTTQHTSSQLVFGRDVILNINQEAYWQLIKQGKKVPINKVNLKDNHQRQSHVYHIGDKVLLKNAWKTKFNLYLYEGPYTVTEVRNNVMIHAWKGNITDIFNLHNITPYKK